MTEKFINYQVNFQTKDGKFFISETPTGEQTFLVLPIKEKHEGLFGTGIIFEPKSSGELKAK
jgi:hypothetical protein